MTDNVQIPGFRLIRKVGEGGMATVYLAVQESLDREVALKVMSPVLAANAAFCEQFMKEGRIAARLTHPHLMTVHDIGEEHGVYYLASEYLPAGTLRDRMEGIGVAEMLEIARDVAAGLAYAHSNGFVHRDVKPGNIMFRSDDTAVLADFGIAKAMNTTSSQTMTGTAIGTPDYMSPEQAQANPVDGRSDLYSLGAVLFECLAGHKAYRAGDPYTVALMHVTEPVPKLPEDRAWLQPLIDGLMAKKPEERFASGEAFIIECERLMATHPELQTPTREKRTTRKRAVMPRRDAASLLTGRGVLPNAEPSSARRFVVMGAAALAALAVLSSAGYWMFRAPSAATVTTPPAVTPDIPPPTLPDETNQALASLQQLDLPTLLAKGQEYLEYGQVEDHYGRKLDYPAGDNAIDMFQEVIRREPSNAIAAKGLAQIAAFYEHGARIATEHGADPVGTVELIDKGLRAEPKNSALLKLRAELTKGQQGG
jgi:serine/threonine protein kinase